MKNGEIPLNPIKPPFSYGFPMVFPAPSGSMPWESAGAAGLRSQHGLDDSIQGLGTGAFATFEVLDLAHDPDGDGE